MNRTYSFFFCLAYFSLASACAAFHERSLVVQTVPEKATVAARTGEKLGESPLTLTGETLTRLEQEGTLELHLSAPGYLDRELVMRPEGLESYKIALQPLDAEYFSQRLLNEFPKQLNAMLRELLQIQALVISGRPTQAETALTEFQKHFPNVAAGYVLLSSIEAQKGNRQRALAALFRAHSIDPEDPVASRMISSTNK